MSPQTADFKGTIDMQTDIKKGELITIATGAYSDYSISGVFRVLADFNPQEQMEKFAAETPLEDDDTYRDLSEFIAWISRSGLLEPLESREWHIGSYGRLESGIF